MRWYGAPLSQFKYGFGIRALRLGFRVYRGFGFRGLTGSCEILIGIGCRACSMWRERVVV